MSSPEYVGAEFIGGPWDGQTRDVPVRPTPHGAAPRVLVPQVRSGRMTAHVYALTGAVMPLRYEYEGEQEAP